MDHLRRITTAAASLIATAVAGRDALAGDLPYLLVDDHSGGHWGIGEISGQLLLYTGRDTLLTEVPASALPFGGTMVVLVGILVACLSLTRKAGPSEGRHLT